MRILITFFLIFFFQINYAQNTPWPTTGNVGIGTTTPTTLLEVKTTTTNDETAIKASGFDPLYSLGRGQGTVPINSLIGIGGPGYDLGGLTYYDDGNGLNMGLSARGKLIANYGVQGDSKFFRILNAETNYPNYSFLFQTSPNSTQSDIWYRKGGATIVSFLQPLNIGSGSVYPVRIYSDGGNANKVADIFIQYSKVGIGTETPNANAKLDVNGNIYSNGKVFIGTPDGNTANKIAPYSLAVNGTAMFTKAIVKLYNAWPDYVFDMGYKLPSLDEIEQFIQLNGHLPEVPTAKEVEENGINLGDNQVLLLKKVEELTLLLIEQNKKILEQNSRIDKLEKSLEIEAVNYNH